METLVYLSTAVQLLTDEQLTDLLKVSRKNNTAMNLTGLLLYSDGTFLQVLEGEAEAIDSVLQKIEQDPRHKNIIILIDEPIEKRTFADWSMGFASVKANQADDLLGYLRSADKISLKDGNSSAISTVKTFIDHNQLNISYKI